ncbi:transferase family-domain-containing protein [Xylariaceae sp. FL0804]|nr:transferase family-domain-containing protein [Xylariaceae sp. FL0804]
MDINDLDRYQDILGQLPMLQTYTQILYFFPNAKDVPSQQIVEDLSDAITTIRKAVPWMGARISNVGKGPGTSGVYKPVKCALPDPAIDVRHLEDAAPAYEQFRRARAPLSMIDTGLLAPVAGFPSAFEDTEARPAHAVRAQASFVRGGVVVALALQHNVADAGGFRGLVDMVATRMRGKPLPAATLAAANRDRRGAVPLLPDGEPTLDHTRYVRPPLTADAPLVPPVPARYHVFRFTVAAIARLKRIATTSPAAAAAAAADAGPDAAATPAADGPFVLTDDAVCAFCWQHLLRARWRARGGGGHTLDDDATVLRFGRQIDGRRAAGLPATYMGAMAFTVTCEMAVGELVGAPLAAVAARLRRSLDAANTVRGLRSFATFVARTADKATITYAGRFDPDADVGSSSVRAHARGLFPDFGPRLGVPEFIRCPPGVPFAGTLVLWPGNAAGDCDAIACLTEADFDALRGDPEWNEFVEYIG